MGGDGKFVSIVAGKEKGNLYGISSDDGAACKITEKGYKQLTDNPGGGFKSLAAGSGNLYGLLFNGLVAEFTGDLWEVMSLGSDVTFGAITAGGGKLYGLSTTGKIYEIRSDLLVVQGNNVANTYKTIVAGNEAVYSTDSTFHAWKITLKNTVQFGNTSSGAGIFEVLCTDNSCPLPK